MSSDFDTKLVYDQRLADISDKLTFAVRKGASDNSFQKFQSNSATPSSINFTITPPSESTACSRHVFIQSTVKFTISVGESSGANLANGQSAWSYGLRDSCQSFPLSRLFNTCTASINNVSTSVSLNHVLPGILRTLDKEYMQKMNGGTPTYLDNYGLLPDAVGNSNSPMNDFTSASFNDCLQPRGVHPILPGFVIERWDGNAIVDDSPISQAPTNYWKIKLRTRHTEPIFVPPFIFGDARHNESSFIGINNFQLLLNVDPTMSRFWSTGLPLNNGQANNTSYSLALDDFENTYLLMNFLTAPPTLVLPSKQVLPYASYTAYLSTNNEEIQPKLARTKPPTATLTINSIQLEVVPDKLLVYVRRPLSSQNARTSDSFLTIKKLSVTFGNKSGILSNIEQVQLWEMSRRNQSNQDYYAFKGLVNKSISSAPFIADIPTAGSVVCIDPTYDLSIDSSYVSAGSIGQFNIQIDIDVENNFPEVIKPEIVVVAIRAGMIVTSAGQSTLTTNVLSAAIVTDTIENDKEPMGSLSYKRLVGGAGEGSSLPSGGARSGGMKSVSKYGGVRKGSKLSNLAM
ncbi:MAG: phage major capsid domain-containing protein [Promethearchaeota archaeon]|jgi:hypothetical protein